MRRKDALSKAILNGYGSHKSHNFSHLLLHSPHPHTGSQAYIPLVTVLLSISEQQFFLTYWHLFLTQVILPNIKVRGWEE